MSEFGLVVVTWLCLREDRLLAVQPVGVDCYYLPGGLPEPGESWVDAVVREVREEMAVELERSSLELVAEVTGPAHGRPGQLASLVAFRGTGIGDPVGQLPEIDRCRRLGPGDVHLLAPLARAAAEQAWVGRQAGGWS